MPPKKAPNAASKKTENKKKEKTLDDKTFGLKNKKGGKQQKFIAQVEKQVKAGGNQDYRKQELEREKEKKRKAEEQKKEEEMKALFKPIAGAQKVGQGVDPKSVFCAFFKQGLCKKGDKCKFSHDPGVEGKAAKRNIYAQEEEKEDGDNMDDWDDDKLADVVNQKHGSEKANTTDIICKHFLEALENNKYGWFWECPMLKSKNCMYKHALPKGFVLKKDRKRMEKEREEISIEDLIEKERGNLDTAKLTKVNIQTFVAWKKKKLKEKDMEEKKSTAKKERDMKSGKTGGMSGREMFMFNPSMVSTHVEGEDDEEGGEFDLGMRDNDDDPAVKVHEIKFDAYGIMDDGLDDSTDVQLARAAAENGGAAAAAASSAVEVDEDLFDDEDLDELEEDMDKLDV